MVFTASHYLNIESFDDHFQLWVWVNMLEACEGKWIGLFQFAPCAAKYFHPCNPFTQNTAHLSSKTASQISHILKSSYMLLTMTVLFFFFRFLFLIPLAHYVKMYSEIFAGVIITQYEWRIQCIQSISGYLVHLKYRRKLCWKNYCWHLPSQKRYSWRSLKRKYQIKEIFLLS